MRALLKERQLTMKAASRLAGRGETWVRDILERDQEPSTANFEALAQALNVSVAELLGGKEDRKHNPDDRRVIPIMGYVGAGADIEPDGEQPPPEGFDQVELPFALDAETIGFEVRGTSMLPAYEDGEVIVCFREQRRAIDWFIGRTAVVRTVDGKRCLKRVTQGRRANAYTLRSWNAEDIEDVGIDWVGEIVASVKAEGIRHVGRPGKKRPLAKAERRMRK